MGVAYSEPVTGREVLASWRLGDRGLGGVVLVVPGWEGQLWGYLMRPLQKNNPQNPARGKPCKGETCKGEIVPSIFRTHKEVLGLE